MFHKLTIFGIALLLLFKPAYLSATQQTITTSISAREMYDDNIHLWSRAEKDDFVTLIRPTADLDVKTERADIKGRVHLNIMQYADETDLNTVEQTYTLGAHFLSSERLSLGLNGRYIRDTILETELIETGVAVTELGLARTIRKNYSFSPSATYTLSERDTLSLTPFYTRSDYESDRWSDYWVSGATLDYRHLLGGERLSLISQLGYNYLKFKPSYYIFEGRYHNCQLYGGINYLFSETLTMDFLVGVRYTDSKMTYWIYPFITPYEEKTVGWLADASLSKTLPRGSFTLGARREILPSGVGDLLEANRFYIHFINKFTERLQGEIRASYYRGEGVGRIRTYHTWHVIPTLRYYLMKYLILELNYSYTSLESGAHSAQRNTVFLGITWLWKHLWE